LIEESEQLPENGGMECSRPAWPIMAGPLYGAPESQTDVIVLGIGGYRLEETPCRRCGRAKARFTVGPVFS
jgi:hypothetical protein